MDQNILVAIIGSVSALLGAGVGGVITYYTTKSIKAQEWKRSIQKETYDEKKQIYASFLKEYNNLTLMHRDEMSNDPFVFNNITFQYSQIELLSNEPMIQIAHELLTDAVTKDLAESKTDSSVLRQNFIAQVREELQGFQHH